MPRSGAVRYRMLGSVEVVSAGDQVELGGRHQRLLLAALLLHAGRAVSADRLCELLWGERQPAHPAAALRSQIARLRSTLAQVGGAIRVDAGGYRLDVEPDEVDANCFEDLVEAAGRSSPETAVALLHEALDLWHGAAVSEFADHPLVQPAAVRLEELRSTAVERRAELLLGLDRPAEAVSSLRPLVAQCSQRERARGLLMEALYRAGRHTDALAEYRLWRHHLATELGLEPSPALQRLQADILRHSVASRSSGPVRRRPHRAKVPRSASSFIGRTDELTQLASQLAPGRLVTVAGPGGVGKTRLALEVLARSGEHLGAGAFADLSAVTDGGLVAAVVGDAVDMPATGGIDDRDSILSFLADRDVLLVIDNCEHLLAAASDLVADLLAECPRVRVLATSRQPLGIDGECVWRLPPLTGADATALFVERATDGGARLALDRDLSTIGEICARLDGIPLAVELAAKHAAHVALPQLRDLLEDRFRLLVGGSTQVLARQRTLEATLAWSYELLEDDERHLLRHIAVFAGPFTIDAAAFVNGTVDPVTAAHLLGTLHRQSLLSFDHESRRYRLLETVRAFGRERLTESDELGAANERLYDWLLEAAPGPWRYPFGPESPEHVDAELDNVRSALGWCASAGRLGAGAALAAAYGPMWFMTIRGNEALGWLVLPPTIDDELPLDARLAWRTAAVYAATGVWNMEQLRSIDDYLSLAAPRHPARCALLFIKAWSYIQSDHAEGRRLLAAVRVEAGADRCWQSNCDLIDGQMYLLDGQVTEAVSLFESAVEHARGPGAASAQLNLAVAFHLADRHDDVTAIVNELDLHQHSPGGFWGDVVGELILVLDAVGHRDLDGARQALARLMTTTTRRYSHVRFAYGFGVHAAVVVAFLAGRPDDALTLLAGSRRHHLDLRYEGAMALGRAYEARCRDTLPPDRVTTATTRGANLSLDAVIDLTNRTARAREPRPVVK